MTSPVLPGSTIGLLGSGQLGRMIAIAARRMGYRVHTLSPETDSPTGHVADREVVAAYDDVEAVKRFAADVDVITLEFENISAECVDAASSITPVRPKGSVLHTTQNRLREKTFLAEHGFPVAPFRHVRSREELAAAVEEIGTPAVLKTAGFGYDGKGQVKMEKTGDVAGDVGGDVGGGWRRGRSLGLHGGSGSGLRSVHRLQTGAVRGRSAGIGR